MVTSVGDGMRELDKKALLKNDFVVVYGDVVSNATLDAALAEHRRRRAADKNCIMTMVLRAPGGGADERRRGAPVFALDARSGRCLHYETMGFGAPERFVSVSEDVLKESKHVEVRADLHDCGIDVCTPEVLALWSDNFDFHAPRRNFLHSVLKDYELNGKKFHAHVLPATAGARAAYAHRVRSLRDYAAVSRQLVSRWAYPFGPDSNLAGGSDRDGGGPPDYRASRGLVYEESGVQLARSSTVGPRAVVGRGASVGHEARVAGSVVGRGARIGAGAVVEDSFVWDHAVVGAGAVVRNAIVGSRATLGAGVVLQPGALVGNGVVVADGTTVRASSRLTLWRRRRPGAPLAEPLERVAPDPAAVGVGGDGAEYAPDEDDHDGNGDDEDAAAREAVALYHGLAAVLHAPPPSWDACSPLTSAPSTPPRSPSVSSAHSRRHSRHLSMSSLAGDDSATGAGGFLSLGGAARRAAIADYHAEAVRLLLEALPAGVAPENVQIDFNSLRLAHDARPPMQRRALAVALARHVLAAVGGAGAGALLPSAAPEAHEPAAAAPAEPPMGPAAAAAKVVPLYVFLLRRSVATSSGSGPEAAAAAEEQSELLSFLQAELARQGRPSEKQQPEKADPADASSDGKDGAAAATAAARSVMPFAVRELVRLDVVDAEGLERWWDDPRSRASDELAAVREGCAELVKFLCEDDDSDDGEEEGSSEGD
jgi:translation initiation factor eIF-2B subunit epsilon